MARSWRRTALAEGSGSPPGSPKRIGSSPRGTGGGTGGGGTGRPGSVSLTLDDAVDVEAGSGASLLPFESSSGWARISSNVWSWRW